MVTLLVLAGALVALLLAIGVFCSPRIDEALVRAWVDEIDKH